MAKGRKIFLFAYGFRGFIPQSFGAALGPIARNFTVCESVAEEAVCLMSTGSKDKIQEVARARLNF